MGQRPDLAIDAAKEALLFFMEQTLFARAMIHEDYSRRIESVQTRCKEKLDSIYSAYKQLKASDNCTKKDLGELQVTCTIF